MDERANTKKKKKKKKEWGRIELVEPLFQLIIHQTLGLLPQC